MAFSSHPDIGATLNPGANPLDRFGISVLVRRDAFGGSVDLSNLHAESLQTCSTLGSSSAAMYDPIAATCAAGQYPLFSRRPVLIRFDGVSIDHQIARLDGMVSTLPTKSDLTVIVTHFKSQLNPGDDERRVAEVSHVAGIVAREQALGRQVVVMGDFNTAYGAASRFLQPLRDQNMVDMWDVVNPWKRFSYNFAGVSGVLDHIFISRGLFTPVATTLAPMGNTLRTGSLELNSDWPTNGIGVGGAPSGGREATLAYWSSSPIGTSDHDPVWLKLGGYSLDPAFQRGLGSCALEFVCAAFSGIGGNPSFCAARQSGMMSDGGSEKSKSAKQYGKPDDFAPTEGDSLQAYRLFRDKFLMNSEQGQAWANRYYAASPALTEMMIQDPSLGLDVLALMYRFADAFERIALGHEYDPADLIGSVDIERLQRVQSAALAKLKLDPKTAAALATLPKPEELAQYQGKSSYQLIINLLYQVGILEQ